MAPMATDPNTVNQSSSCAKKVEHVSYPTPFIIRYLASTGNGKLSSSQLMRRNNKSSQMPCVDCKKTVSCDSRKERIGLRKSHCGSSFKVSDAKQCNFGDQKSNSPLPKTRTSKYGRGKRQKMNKLGSSYEKIIHSSERKEFVEDLIVRFEKVVMGNQKSAQEKARDAVCGISEVNSSEVSCSVTKSSSSNSHLEESIPAQASQSSVASKTDFTSPTGAQNQPQDLLRFLLPSTCKEQKCDCSTDLNRNNEQLFKSTLLYNDCSDSASSRIVILASCVNEYIRSVFMQLDHQNRGSISIEEFECLCKVLGINSSFSQTNKRASWVNMDGRIELPGFKKLLWECVMNGNQKLPASLEDRRSSAILANSVLNASKSLKSLESITDDLRGISKSIASNEKLSRVAGDDALPKGNGNQLAEKSDSNLDALKDFSESSIICYEENKRMKSIIEDLRKALQASDAENLALKVKFEMLIEALNADRENHQKYEAGNSSKSDSPSAKGKHRLSVDSTYGSEKSNQSTPLWTRKRQFFDELLSHYQPKAQKDTETCTNSSGTDAPPSDKKNHTYENHEFGSDGKTTDSEGSYLCMNMFQGRSKGTELTPLATTDESIYAPIVDPSLSFEQISKSAPKPSPRRLKTQGVSYSPNRARLHRSGLSRKSLRMFENLLPPTPPSIDSIPKHPSVALRSPALYNTSFQKALEHETDCNPAPNSVTEVKKDVKDDSSRPEEMLAKARSSAIVVDQVHLRKETEIGSNTFRESAIPYTVTSFSSHCPTARPTTARWSLMSFLPSNDSSRPCSSSTSADKLDCPASSSSSPCAPNSESIYRRPKMPQSSNSVGSVANSIETPASSCIASKSAMKRFIRQRKGASVPELSSVHLNSGWHATLRHSTGHMKNEATFQPQGNNTPNTRKIRSQPLPQLLAARAMLEATLNAVLLNNRLIADNGVRSLTPETLRRNNDSGQQGVSSAGGGDDHSGNSTYSLTAPEDVNEEAGKSGGSDQRNEFPGVKAGDSSKNDKRNDSSSLRFGNNFAVEHGKEKLPIVSKTSDGGLSKTGKNLTLPSIPEFSVKLPSTDENAAALNKLHETSTHLEKISPVPSSVDELVAELVGYCKENGVDISNASSDNEPFSNNRAISSSKNINERQLYSLDEASESHEDTKQVKEAPDASANKTRFEAVQESGVHNAKSLPSEEIYISSCGSDDSGRGDSEGSCSSPDDFSGGSDDGIWTPVDDSPSSEAARHCRCFSDRGSSSVCYFHNSIYHVDLKVNHMTCERNKSFTNHEALHRNTPCHGCGQVSCNCSYITEKNTPAESFLYRQKSSKECENSKERDGNATGKYQDSENELLVKEVYDNIASTLPRTSTSHREVQNNIFFADRKSPTSSETELQIIDLDEKPDFITSDPKINEKLTSEKESPKPKGFLGRRCRSFNTFRSFLSHTASQLKRNSIGRSSFSLPRTSSKTCDEFVGLTEKELPKSIVKRSPCDYTDQKKKKRISFKDTVDIFPIKCQSGTPRIGDDEQLRCEKYSSYGSENFAPESNNPYNFRACESPKPNIYSSLMADEKKVGPVRDNDFLNSIKTLIPANHNNVTLIPESYHNNDLSYNLSSQLIVPGTSNSSSNLEHKGTQESAQLCLTSSTLSPDVKVVEAESIPESRALLEALEEDLDVILKALTEDESKFQ